MIASTARLEAIAGVSAVVRVRRGPLRASFRASTGPPRVLFSVPRSVGTAVVRNRTRRRLRESIREVVRSGALALDDGEYRVGTSTSLEQMSATELRTAILELTRSLGRP